MTVAAWHPPLPTVARLGFDRGWLVLPPTFLNLGVPAVLVDHRLVGDLNLEPFADHRPSTAWKTANSDVVLYWDGTIGLWQKTPKNLISSQRRPAGWNSLTRHNHCLLIVGDTYDVELSWSGLWHCAIGSCEVSLVA